MSSAYQHHEPITGLMPVLNAMPYLRQTLESIAAQRYPAFELIAWDNGSTDGSVDELRRWISHRIPGRVVTGQPLPLGRCRAALVERAQNECCAWFDADDLYAPQRLAVQASALAERGDAALVSSNMRVIDAQGNPTGEMRRYARGDAEVCWGLRFGNPIAQPAAMFRRSAVLAAGNYPDLPGEEDYEMWLRLSLWHRLVVLEQTLVDYRVHDRNTTHRFDHDRQRHVRERQLRLHALLFPGLGQDETARLYRSLCAHELCEINRDDLDRLAAAARCVADATGVAESSIRQTRLFRAQWRNLRTRALKRRAGLRQLWPVLQAGKRVVLRTKSLLKAEGGPRWASRV